MNHFKIALSYYWFGEKTTLYRYINGIFYFLRKLPLVGKHIPVSLYKNYDLKRILFVLALIGNGLVKIVAKFLWYGAGALVALLAKVLFELEVSAFVCWFFLTPLLWRFYEGYMQVFTKNQVEFVRNFQLSPQRFIEMQMTVELLIHLVAYLPVWVMFTLITQESLWLLVSLSGAYVGFSWLFYYFNRFLVNVKLGFRSLIGLAYTVVVLGGMSAFLWGVPGERQMQLVTHPVFALGMLLLAGLSYWLLFTYPQEAAYVTRLLTKTDDGILKYSTVNQTTNTYLGEGLKMQKELTLDENDHANLSGGHYLNAVLFSRYRKTLTKQLTQRLVGILGVGVVLIVLLRFVPGGALNEREVIKLLPVLFFVMYFLAFGKKVVQLVFINCDSSMLYYPFYRERQTILQGFMYRFWQTFKLNSILSLAMFISFLGVSLFNGFFLSGSFFGVLAFLLLSLSFLFSFHELFIYYILQPFTSDLEVINPVYKIISTGFYWVAYLNLQVRASGLVYVVGLATVSLIYVAIGLTVIFALAPKTFRFKG